jgi:hypothetical protein
MKLYDFGSMATIAVLLTGTIASTGQNTPMRSPEDCERIAHFSETRVNEDGSPAVNYYTYADPDCARTVGAPGSPDRENAFPEDDDDADGEGSGDTGEGSGDTGEGSGDTGNSGVGQGNGGGNGTSNEGQGVGPDGRE